MTVAYKYTNIRIQNKTVAEQIARE